MEILYLLVVVVGLWLVIKVFKKPIKFILKMLINTFVGFVVLFLLNLFGIDIELNLLNALVTGILGLPGVIILLIFRYLL